MYKTVFPNKENKIKETKTGQKDVWTARKGDINIYDILTEAE